LRLTQCDTGLGQTERGRSAGDPTPNGSALFGPRLFPLLVGGLEMIDLVGSGLLE
jgi:hypothetical protein